MKTDMECLVGIDLGTSGCKVTIMDVDGRIICEATERYPTYYPANGWAEQDPRTWLQSLRSSLRKALNQAEISPSRVVAIGIDGQVHTAVFINEKFEVLRPAIIWTDKRSVNNIQRLKTVLGTNKIIKITFNPPVTSFTLPHIMWVKENQPDIWKQTYKILWVKDYIRSKLTEKQWVTDHTDATGSLLFDANKFKWSEIICDAAEVPLEKLPEISPSTKIAGYVNRKASRETGIPEGIPVIVGASDVSVENLSAGTVEPGTCFIKLATSGVISVTTSNPTPDPLGRAVTYCLPTSQDFAEGWFTKSGTSSCVSSYEWFINLMFKQKSVSTIKSKNIYVHFDKMAKKAPIGSRGLFFHPYLIGELSPYFDPYLRGSFFGITLCHKREDFCRAVLEGVAFSIRDSLHIFEELGFSLRKAILIGGGTKSPIWRQILCDVLGINGATVKGGDASFGAAMLAGIGAGIFRDLLDATKKCVRIDKYIKCRKESFYKYQKLFKVYREIHDKLADVAKLLYETIKNNNNFIG
jgi:xylulokinase